MTRICVIGDGGWGTALAIRLNGKGHIVTLWGIFRSYIDQIRRRRENVKFLKGVRIPKAVTITSSMDAALDGAEIAVLAVPSKYMRGVLARIKRSAAASGILYVSAAKGIETGTLMRMSEVVLDVLGKRTDIVSISGPSIANEVAKGLPATLVSASRRKDLAQYVQKAFISERLRLYTTDDIIGVELGGALKNIIAIAAGISDSMGFGTNTKAAILTRGIAEISRLGKAMGAREETFFGLSGIGDLVTTCISPHSRNRWFGQMLGKGKKAKDILAGTEMVVEGVTTAKSAYELSVKHKVDMPITREVYDIIYHGKSPKEAVSDLMLRSAKPERY